MNAEPTAIPREAGSGAQSGDLAARVATRLRHNAVPDDLGDRRLPSFALGHKMSGDIGHLHAAHDLRQLPVAPGRRRAFAPLVVRFRSLLRRALYPLPEAQSVWNGANARVISFLVRQLAEQARAIEVLEQQVAELREQQSRR